MVAMRCAAKQKCKPDSQREIKILDLELSTQVTNTRATTKRTPRDNPTVRHDDGAHNEEDVPLTSHAAMDK